MLNNINTTAIEAGAPLVALTVALNLCTFLGGLTCNLLVSATIARTPHLRASSINRAVLSLCVADLVCVLAELPLATFIIINSALSKQPVDEAVCALHSLSHSLSQSVQMMAFPVIGFERYFSISRPFEKQNHLSRVNILCGCVWLCGACLSVLSAYVFPVTAVSFYCSRSYLTWENRRQLLLKSYCVLLPFGIACLSITVGSYSLIVWRVRRQNKKAAIACMSKRLRKTRALSCAAPGHGCKGRALSLAVGVAADSAAQSEDEEGSSPIIAKRSRWRRTSLPLHQKRMRSSAGVSMEMSNLARGKGRPQLIKQAALCLEEESSTKGDGQDTPVLQRPSGRFLAPPPHHVSTAVAAHWLRNNEESSVSSINTAEKPTQLTTAFNSFEDEEATTNKDEYDDEDGTGAGLLMAQLAAPVIALSLPPRDDLPSRCQTPSPSRRPARHRPSSPRQFLMRRCQSATTGDGAESSLESALTRPAPPSSVTPRLLHGHSLLSALRASQRAFSLRDRDGGKAAAREMRKRRSEVNIAKKSGYIVLAFLVLWLPLPISIAVCGHLTRSEWQHMNTCLNVQLIAHLFGLLTAVTNPIIYALAIRSFRVAFRKMTRRKWNDIRNWLGITCLAK